MNLLPVTAKDFEAGKPLSQTFYDEDGHILFVTGDTLPAGYPLEGMFRTGDGRPVAPAAVEEFAVGGQMEEFPAGEMFPPNGIKPQMWEALQLRLPHRDGQPHYISRLVGYIRGTSILLTIPRVRRQLVGMVEGERVEVRMLTGRNIYVFQADIIKANLAPYPYMHVSFPDKVLRQKLRKAPWARANLPCVVEIDGKRRDATLVNLSATGGRVDAPTALGEKGASIRLSFHAEMDEYAHDFSLAARIMNVHQTFPTNKEHVPIMEHGVEFLDVPEKDVMCLRCLVYQRIAEGFLV